jgi:hypothetical protein
MVHKSPFAKSLLCDKHFELLFDSEPRTCHYSVPEAQGEEYLRPHGSKTVSPLYKKSWQQPAGVVDVPGPIPHASFATAFIPLAA